jgi:hypothetical protein
MLNILIFFSLFNTLLALKFLSIKDNYLLKRIRFRQLSTNNQKVTETGLTIFTPQLDNALKDLSIEQKYSLLIDAAARNFSQSSVKNENSLDSIISLYSEMIIQYLTPTKKATYSLLNAASQNYNIPQLGQVMQLLKSGKFIHLLKMFLIIIL